MCRQVGILMGKKPVDLIGMKKKFVTMLSLSQQGGPDAAGMATIDSNGEYSISKVQGLVPNLFKDMDSNHAFNNWDTKTGIVVGHTRWVTRGTASNPLDNHPLRRGDVLGTHNGTITNADRLFKIFNLPRISAVDSELLVQLVNACVTGTKLDERTMDRALAYIEGNMSAVMVNLNNPNELIIIKGDRPLFFFTNSEKRAMLYSTERQVLEAVTKGEKGWGELKIPHYHIATFSRKNLNVPKMRSFYFSDKWSRMI